MREGGLAELLRRLFIARVNVRVILAGELAVGLLNFGVGCGFFYTKDAVIVTSHLMKVLI